MLERKLKEKEKALEIERTERKRLEAELNKLLAESPTEKIPEMPKEIKVTKKVNSK